MPQIFFKALLGAVLATSMGCSSTPGPSTATGQSSGASGESEAVANTELGQQDPVRCERITPIGTRIGQRVCMRESEWARMQGAGEDMTQDAQRRANQGNPIGS